MFMGLYHTPIGYMEREADISKNFEIYRLFLPILAILQVAITVVYRYQPRARAPIDVG